MSPPNPPPKSPRMDNLAVLSNIHSKFNKEVNDQHTHKHPLGHGRQGHHDIHTQHGHGHGHRLQDQVDGDRVMGAGGGGQGRGGEGGVVYHPLGRKQVMEGYPPTPAHPPPHPHGPGHDQQDQLQHGGRGVVTLPPPIVTATHHHSVPTSTATPRFDIHPPTPPTPSSTGTNQNTSIPLRPAHLNHKTINPSHVTQGEGLELERHSNNEGGSVGVGVGVGVLEGGLERPGVLGRLRGAFLNKSPMSKTWARKSYLQELESLAPSSPTSPTRSNWAGVGSRSVPVTPTHTDPDIDLEGQRRM
jgi:hypothetical protein